MFHPFEHSIMCVLGHVNVIPHHQSDLFQGLLCEFAGSLVGETTCGEAMHAGSMYTSTPYAHTIATVERVSNSEDLMESPEVGPTNLQSVLQGLILKRAVADHSPKVDKLIN